MRLYYRISDSSYAKNKLIGATKEVCLMNFIMAFQEVIFGGSVPPPTYWVPPIRIIADRCERKTNNLLLSTGFPVTVTDLGNAGSLRKAIDLACEECDENDLVYFCEDDYLHLSSAPKYLEEGIKRADYVTLYDHPDKYTSYYNLGEYSKVIKTASSHWRFTVSTCMTFGTTVKKLREDKDVWEKYTSESHPHDHQIFTDLGKKGRRLAVSIPGVACHTDLDFSERINKNTMEPWAVELMIKELERQLEEAKIVDSDYKSVVKNLLEGKSGMVKLMALDALKMQFIK